MVNPLVIPFVEVSRFALINERINDAKCELFANCSTDLRNMHAKIAVYSGTREAHENTEADTSPSRVFRGTISTNLVAAHI